MFISEDGTVTGSVDVTRLDEVEPKSDEAKAQVEALKAEAKAGQEQAVRDAERVNEQARLQHEQLHGGSDSDRQKSQAEAKQDADRQQPEATAGQDDAETKRLQAEAEAAGVTVDRRWGADRLRQETADANARKTVQPKQR